MLEAVNSVLQTAPAKRAYTEQVSPVDSYGGNPERRQKVAQAPYISPYIHMDLNLDMAVLQIRDSETGDVVRQIPTEFSLETRRRELSKEKSLTLQGGAEYNKSQGAGATITAQQQAAFDAAARLGNSNAGNVMLSA